ncbi:hypothetical protein PVIIG_06310, partial [Plasmodium vivax India VII]
YVKNVTTKRHHANRVQMEKMMFHKNSFLCLIFGKFPNIIINVLLKFTIISAPILVLFVILFKVNIFFFKI